MYKDNNVEKKMMLENSIDNNFFGYIWFSEVKTVCTGSIKQFTLQSHLLIVHLYFVLAQLQIKRARAPWYFLHAFNCAHKLH